jgi:hypothetical protein
VWEIFPSSTIFISFFLQRFVVFFIEAIHILC